MIIRISSWSHGYEDIIAIENYNGKCAEITR
jgi:hypothetical protein